MVDVSQIYPTQWLPYLNQILENCKYLTIVPQFYTGL
jgi:hypothetical protein